MLVLRAFAGLLFLMALLGTTIFLTGGDRRFWHWSARPLSIRRLERLYAHSETAFRTARFDP